MQTKTVELTQSECILICEALGDHYDTLIDCMQDSKTTITNCMERMNSAETADEKLDIAVEMIHILYEFAELSNILQVMRKLECPTVDKLIKAHGKGQITGATNVVRTLKEHQIELSTLKESVTDQMPENALDQDRMEKIFDYLGKRTE